MLKDYNTNKTKIDTFKHAKDMLLSYAEIFDEESETLKTLCYEPEMPLHFGNEFNSKVENIVCKKEQYLLKAKFLDIEIKKLQAKNNYIDNVLDEMDSHERHIVKKRYIEKIKSRCEIIELLKRDTGFYMSISTYNRKLYSAKNKLKKLKLL